MNKDKALKLALEALELAHPRFGIATEKHKQVITAIKESLAQPVPDLTEQQRELYQKGHNDGVAHHKQAVKREWIDLTQEEIDTIRTRFYRLQGPNEFADAIAAKLKEKNT